MALLLSIRHFQTCMQRFWLCPVDFRRPTEKMPYLYRPMHLRLLPEKGKYKFRGVKMEMFKKNKHLQMNKNKARINLNMSHIRSKDTKPELLLRKELWHRGLRYRKNAKNVMGHPDIVFLRAQIAVFCDGSLWHGYEWDTLSNKPERFDKIPSVKMPRNQSSIICHIKS